MSHALRDLAIAYTAFFLIVGPVGGASFALMIGAVNDEATLLKLILPWNTYRVHRDDYHDDGEYERERRQQRWTNLGLLAVGAGLWAAAILTGGFR